MFADSFMSPQLAEIEMTSRRSGRPAKEDVACCLHRPLPTNHAFARVVQPFRVEMLFDHRKPRLFDLQEHGLPQFVGYLRSLDDFRSVVLRTSDAGTPVLLGDV